MQPKAAPPYNPRLRPLTSEISQKTTSATQPSIKATLLQKVQLTPTIYKYRFSLPSSSSSTSSSRPSPTTPYPRTPGQHVLLDFSSELDMGYQHMSHDNPTSLNDDFLRTFTVSSPPPSPPPLSSSSPTPSTSKISDPDLDSDNHFEMIVRKVGPVTKWLSQQRPSQSSGSYGTTAPTEIDFKGFGGEFIFDQKSQENNNKTMTVGFIAAGIGITPLLSQLRILDFSHLKVFWAVHVRDAGLVLHVLESCAALKPCLNIYLTGELSSSEGEVREKLEELMKTPELNVQRRRMRKDDLIRADDQEVDRWYLCTQPAMRKLVQEEWLPGKSVAFENFDY